MPVPQREIKSTSISLYHSFAVFILPVLFFLFHPTSTAILFPPTLFSSPYYLFILSVKDSRSTARVTWWVNKKKCPTFQLSTFDSVHIPFIITGKKAYLGGNMWNLPHKERIWKRSLKGWRKKWGVWVRLSTSTSKAKKRGKKKSVKVTRSVMH